jgi:hypothetical protein
MKTVLLERNDHAARVGRSRFSLISRPILAVVSLFLLGACSALPTSIVPEGASFDGMNALVTNGLPPRPLRILTVHGMGTTDPGQFEGFIASLASRLRLVQISPPRGVATNPDCPDTSAAPTTLVRPDPIFVGIPGVPRCMSAQLYTYAFASAADGSQKPVLIVSFLLWAPLTKTIEKTALDESSAPPRQEFADLAKYFIDYYLGDVILYGGTYRVNVMRPSIQKALCLITQEAPTDGSKPCTPGPYNDPTIIITHSLGGYMMIDSMGEELRRENCGKGPRRTASGKILDNTDYIFMMANQVALLDLTTLRNYPSQPEGAPLENAHAKRFVECWKPRQLSPAALPQPADRTPPPEALEGKQVVAFSDPNDILTWEVDKKNLGFPRPEWPHVKLTNVYLQNGEFSIPGLFSEPTTAHNGYLNNQTVLELIVCGMSKGAVTACLPNGLP